MNNNMDQDNDQMQVIQFPTAYVAEECDVPAEVTEQAKATVSMDDLKYEPRPEDVVIDGDEWFRVSGTSVKSESALNDYQMEMRIKEHIRLAKRLMDIRAKAQELATV